MVYRPSGSPLSEEDEVMPASPYARSKLAQEQVGFDGMSEDGVDVIVARAFNHTGPRQSVAFATPSMARQVALIARGTIEPVLRVGNLASTRDITDVRDVVRAYECLMARGMPGTIYNVASGVGRTMQSVLDGLIALTRVPIRLEQDPEKLRPHDIPAMVGDARRLYAVTGWQPSIPFERTLQDTLDFWRSEVAHK
jgi:GDP-4-dehydro-6-deoxy-D-mannose reductase